MLILLKQDNKVIAELLAIAPRSVLMLRHRFRQKIGLATEYSLENFLDIYQFMPSMQAKKAAELGRIAAEAAAGARAAREALEAGQEGEELLRELSARYFIEKLASSIEEESL